MLLLLLRGLLVELGLLLVQIPLTGCSSALVRLVEGDASSEAEVPSLTSFIQVHLNIGLAVLEVRGVIEKPKWTFSATPGIEVPDSLVRDAVDRHREAIVLRSEAFVHTQCRSGADEMSLKVSDPDIPERGLMSGQVGLQSMGVVDG